MSELIVVGYHGKHRAAEVLDELRRLHDEWTIDLEDGVAAYRRDNGRLRVEQSVNPTEKEGGALGATLGLVVGAVLAAPFTAGASAAVAAGAIGSSAAAAGMIGAVAGAEDAIDWKDRFGITDDFVREVGGMIQPGDSAVFALVTAHNRDEAVKHFTRSGGTILRTTLNPVDAARVRETIRA